MSQTIERAEGIERAAEGEAATRAGASRALSFRRLRVERMPWLTGSYSLDELSPGINIIHGPNASGKTTTARALESILWPRDAAPRGAFLDADLLIDGEGWRIGIEAGAASHQREGAEASPPVLPPAEARDRYRLSLHELLVSENETLVDAIVRESAGGYDITGAASSLGTRARPPARRGAEANAYVKARTLLDEAYDAEKRLQHDERRLVDLTSRHEAAKRAAARVALLERAVEYAEAIAAEAEAAAVVEAYPAEVAALNGDEIDQLARIRKRLADLERTLGEAETARREAEAALREAGIVADGEGGEGQAILDDEALGALRERLSQLRHIDHSISTSSIELASAQAQAAEELQRIGEVVDEVRLQSLDVVAIDRLAGFAERAGRVRADLQAAEARLALLDGPGAGGGEDLEKIGRGVNLLQQWLRAGAGASAEQTAREGRLRGLGAAAAVALAVVGGVAAVMTGMPVVWGAVVVGVLLLLMILRPAPTPADPREVHQREYERLGLGRPGAWTPDSVAELLDGLEARRAEARLAEARTAERENIARECEAFKAKWQELDRQRAELAEEFGVGPELDPAAFFTLANRISRWQDARGKVAGSSAALETLRRDRAIVLTAAATQADSFGQSGVTDQATLSAAIDELGRRLESHRRALTELRHAESGIESARKEIESLAAERASILERVGLAVAGTPGTVAADQSPRLVDSIERAEELIREWCGLLLSYRDAVSERLEAEGRLKGAREKLTSAIGYEPGIEDRGIEELRAELDEAREVAAEAEELKGQIAGIEALIEKAREGHAVEDALAAVEAAEAELRAAREKDIRAIVGHTLVEYLKSATRDDQRPAVFHRARELFALITRGRYRLDFADEGKPAFRAFDTTTNRGHSLEELSSATRVQLLLAVRIAFVESQEGGLRLPLIFDETLGNSDDDRAAAIIEATIALAAEGRQIFYFTAQPDEVGKWKSILAGAGVDWAVHDLAEARSISRHEALPPIAIEPVERWEPPAPDGMSHEEYGKVLLVPGIDLQAEVGGVHLWHLVEEPELLYRLLRRSLESWGALESLVEYGGGAVLGDDQREYPRIRAAARALEAALELARIGRGRPVDWEEIESSGIFTDAFRDRARQLLIERNGDAAAFIEAIEGGALARFQNRKREELREKLEEWGCIDTREPIPPEELRSRVLAAVADEVGSGVLEPGTVERIIASLP